MPDGRFDILLGLALDEQEQQYDDDDEDAAATETTVMTVRFRFLARCSFSSSVSSTLFCLCSAIIFSSIVEFAGQRKGRLRSETRPASVSPVSRDANSVISEKGDTKCHCIPI